MSNREEGVAWLSPWTSFTDRDVSWFERELHRELAQGHPMFDRMKGAKALAENGYDVLFELCTPTQYAVVNLRFIATAPPQLPLPHTDLFETIRDFFERRMKPDHDDFTKPLDNDG